MRNLIGSPFSNQGPAGDLVEALRMLAHGFSQPLTALRGSVEVALLGDLNKSECRQTLELALQESRRMAEMLQALRDVLEIEECSEEATPVSWTQSVESLLQEPAFANHGRGLRLVSDLQADVWVKAVPHLLEKAVGRLIGRAVKVSGGKGRIRVQLSARGQTACLSVCGGGRLAAPGAGGRRLPSTSELTEPAGLGDWIIRRAIECQGGGYEVIQRSGTRRCHQLNLPVAPAQVKRQA